MSEKAVQISGYQPSEMSEESRKRLAEALSKAKEKAAQLRAQAEADKAKREEMIRKISDKDVRTAARRSQTAIPARSGRSSSR